MEPQAFEEAYKVRATDNLVYGPVNLAALLEWAKDGRVVPGTLIHCQSEDAWQKAEAIPALREALQEAKQAASEPADSAGAPEEMSIDELRQFPRFARLPDKQVEQVRRFGELCAAPPDTLIIRRGDPGDALYLVLAGEVRVRLVIGLEDKTLSTIGPGKFFGEMALFNNSPRSADVVAVTETRLMRLTKEAFMLFIDEIPQLAGPILYDLASTMADRLVAANKRFQLDTAADFVWR